MSYLCTEMIQELCVVNNCLLNERRRGGLWSGYAALTFLVIDFYHEMGIRKYPQRSFASGRCRHSQEMFIAQALTSCLDLCHTQHRHSMLPVLSFPKHGSDYATTLSKSLLFPTEASPNSLARYTKPSRADMTLCILAFLLLPLCLLLGILSCSQNRLIAVS